MTKNTLNISFGIQAAVNQTIELLPEINITRSEFNEMLQNNKVHLSIDFDIDSKPAVYAMLGGEEKMIGYVTEQTVNHFCEYSDVEVNEY